MMWYVTSRMFKRDSKEASPTMGNFPTQTNEKFTHPTKLGI
jgi:hypothetical protein